MNLKVLIIALLVICIIGVGAYFIFNKINTSNRENVANTEEVPPDETFPPMILGDNGIPEFIDGAFSDVKVNSKEDVLAALDSIKELMNIKNVNDEFNVLNGETSEGMTYYRLQQKYKSVEIYGQQLVVAVDKDGTVSSLSGEYIPNVSISTDEKITAGQAEEVVKIALGDTTQISSNKKYIYDGDLVFVIEASSNTASERFFVSAIDGSILDEENLMKDVTAYPTTQEGLLGARDDITIEELEG